MESAVSQGTPPVLVTGSPGNVEVDERGNGGGGTADGIDGVEYVAHESVNVNRPATSTYV